MEYYLREELVYVFALKGLTFQLKDEGKGTVVLRVGTQEKEKFSFLKGLKALQQVSSSDFLGKSLLLSSRRSIWRAEVPFHGTSWVRYYLMELDRLMKEKGLLMRTFCNQEGWLFLLKGVGELRLSQLKYDYYQWNWTLRYVLPFCGNRRVFFSALKLYYRL